jgi:cytochrome c-type biogenesis protein CcmE
MKAGQLLGAAIIVICLVAAGFSMRGSVRQSLTIKEVLASPGEPCSIYGKVVRPSTHYDMRAGRLDFVLKDKKGDTIPVVYQKSKPETFDTADTIKVIGAYREGVFQADDILVKCPSKYEPKPPVPGEKGTPANPYAALGKGA